MRTILATLFALFLGIAPFGAAHAQGCYSAASVTTGMAEDGMEAAWTGESAKGWAVTLFLHEDGRWVIFGGDSDTMCVLDLGEGGAMRPEPGDAVYIPSRALGEPVG